MVVAGVVVVAAVAALVDVDIEAVGDDDDVVGDIAVVGTGGVGFISFGVLDALTGSFFTFLEGWDFLFGDDWGLDDFEYKFDLKLIASDGLNCFSEESWLLFSSFGSFEGSTNLNGISPIWILLPSVKGIVKPFSTKTLSTKAPFLPNIEISNLWVPKL